jgi:pimeloyl-ACP methyl ester carboxylesterase
MPSSTRSAEVASAVRSLAPLLQVLPGPVPVVCPDDALSTAELQSVIAEEAARRHLSAPVVVAELPPTAGVFEEVVSRRLASGAPPTTAGPAPEWVAGLDGTRFRGYAEGPVGGSAVLLVPACGMPIELVRFWLAELAARGYRVLSWETAGMFGAQADRDTVSPRYLDGSPMDRVDAQVADAISLLSHFGVERCGLIALCGGAVIALAAAAARPELFDLVSIWHADLKVESPEHRTRHQVNLAAVLDLGGTDERTAVSVREVLSRSLADNVPPDLAHLVLYPYATGELLFRYCRINGALMSVDAEDFARKVGQPVLVVTSDDDDTAHPGASRAVADLLPHGRLVIRPHGDHISLFRGNADLLGLAVDFLAGRLGTAAG